MKLEEAYKILKENVRYSHSSCEGFVYLSQIEELLSKELKPFNIPELYNQKVTYSDSGNYFTVDYSKEFFGESMLIFNYNQELINKILNREAIIEVDDFTIIKGLINFMYPYDPFLEDGFEDKRLFYGTFTPCSSPDNQYYGKHYWCCEPSIIEEDFADVPRIKASEFLNK